jgi:uncharacterized protein (TIGR03435 family)
MINTPLTGFVMYAYDLRDYQIVGGPGWVRGDRFDVQAKAGREAPIADIRLMLQSLLEDRFKLVTHMERREMQVYELVLDRRDGRLGPNLKRGEEGCQKMLQPPTGVPVGAATLVGCGPIAVLVRSASSRMRAPVIDKTGLSGTFEYFVYMAQESPETLGGAGSPSVDLGVPTYTTALREQLGLKLEATRGLVDVLLIDSVQHPTEN